MKSLNFETVLAEVAKLPKVKIDHEEFLRKELGYRYGKVIADKAIEYNPAYAVIKIEDINIIAKNCIMTETMKVTALSAAAGIHGGLAMIGTIPADLAQFFAHVVRILQKLIYLYGWKELRFESTEMNDETKNLFTLFIGIMLGVSV